VKRALRSNPGPVVSYRLDCRASRKASIPRFLPLRPHTPCTGRPRAFRSRHPTAYRDRLDQPRGRAV